MFGFVDPPATLPVPSPKFQLKKYGEVPLEAVAVNVTPVLTRPEDGPVILTANVGGSTVRVSVAVTVWEVG